MEVIIVTVGIVGAVSAFVVLGYFYFGSRQRADEEQGLQPVYYEQCGGRFDSLNLTVPLVRFGVYPRFIVVAYGGNKHLLRLEDIQDVAVKRHLFSKGIHIRHSRGDIPQSFIIWSLHPRKAMEMLAKQGIVISEM